MVLVGLACHRRHSRSSWPAATAYCSVLAVVYVGSLYVFVPTRIQKLHRDHPSQIKCRSLCTLLVGILSYVSYYVLFCDEWTIILDNEALGRLVQRQSLACAGVMLHTAVLFMGPILVRLAFVYDSVSKMDERVSLSRFGQVAWSRYVHPTVSSLFYTSNESERWVCLRSLVIAPFTEEIVFRVCMVQAFQSIDTKATVGTICAVVPLFFGIAHVHHAMLKLRQGKPLVMVVLETLVQFLYTTLFGAYESYAYIQTESILAVTLCHSFCNTMGLPDLSYLHANSPLYPVRHWLSLGFLVGLTLFFVALTMHGWPPRTATAATTTIVNAAAAAAAAVIH